MPVFGPAAGVPQEPGKGSVSTDAELLYETPLLDSVLKAGREGGGRGGQVRETHRDEWSSDNITMFLIRNAAWAERADARRETKMPLRAAAARLVSQAHYARHTATEGVVYVCMYACIAGCGVAFLFAPPHVLLTLT